MDMRQGLILNSNIQCFAAAVSLRAKDKHVIEKSSYYASLSSLNCTRAHHNYKSRIILCFIGCYRDKIECCDPQKERGECDSRDSTRGECFCDTGCKGRNDCCDDYDEMECPQT